MNSTLKQITSRNGSMSPSATEPPDVPSASNSSRTRCTTLNSQDKPTRDDTKLWPNNLPNNTPLKRNTNCEKTSFRSEEHTSELQSRFDLVCRLLLEKKNIIMYISLLFL